MARTRDAKTTPAPPVADTAAVNEPRYATLWASLVYVVATMTLAYPALGGAFLVSPHSDQYAAGYAFREFAASSLKSGHGFPQWNPYLLGGLPYIAAMHGDIFYPTFLLRMIMRTDQAMTWEFAIHLFLAGLFTYLFLRAWRLAFIPALVGGLAYMLSGPIAAYASPGHDGKLFVSALLPLALLLLVRAMRDGRLWAWGALSVTIGLAILSPHPQLLQYLLLTSGVFALYLAFATHPGAGKLPRDIALKRLGLALGAVVLGLMMGAVQFLPVREYVPWSPRVGGRGYDFATTFSMPIEELINTIVPQFSGILENYWGRNGIHLHSEYAGAVVILLATAAAGGEALKSFRRFWFGVFIVSLIWALGGHTPFYQLIYAIVPGTRYFRAPSTMMFVPMFSLSVLAALGAAKVLARGVSTRFVYGWAIGVLVLLLLGTSGALTNLARTVAGGFAPGGQLDDAVSANGPALVFGTLRSVLFLALALGLIWAFTRDKVPSRAAAWTLVALVGIDLWSIERLYWIFSPPASTIFASDPAIEFLKAAKEPGRVVPLELAVPARPRDPIFIGDGMMPHRVRTLLGYHGNELGRFEHLMQRPAPDARYPTEPQLSPIIWRQENVQYLYTTLPESLAAPLSTQLKLEAPMVKVVGPVRNASGSTVYLYKLPGRNPAAWVTAAIVKAPDDQALATIMDARFDLRLAAIADDSAGNIQAVQLKTLPAPPATQASVGRYDPGAIDVVLDQPASAGQALVVSENYYPGWKATADGKAAPVARMNYTLIGVQLPAGARRIEVRFDDAAYETGKTITLVATLLAIVLWASGAFVERRRAPVTVTG